jgi:c-di-GMP-binding flagellar brake protein YcgR
VEDISNAGALTVMQDNAPVHTAIIVKKWFAEEGADMNLIDWPSNFPT